MTARKPLAFKPFCEALEQHCRTLSYDELVELVIALGARVRPGERHAFLEEVGSLADPAALEVDPGSLAAKAESFAQELQTRWEAIADGSYWELYGDEELEISGRYYRDPFDVPAITEEHWARLLELFAEADSLFADGSLEDARRAYEPLISLFRRGDDLPFHAYASDDPEKLDLRETRARYARCVYETAPLESRLERTLWAMEATVQSPFADLALSDSYPTFTEMAEARRAELPDRESFLQSWRERLHEEVGVSARAQALFLEAVELTEGEPGLQRVAREWWPGRPLAYRYWIEYLRNRERRLEAVHAAREVLRLEDTGSANEAFDSRDRRSVRRYAAETLVHVGRQLQDDEIVLEGRRALFLLERSEESLANLLQAAETLDRREIELKQAIDILAAGKQRHNATHVKALIIAGRLGDTFAIARSGKSVGWSYSDCAMGLCFAAILAHSADRDARRAGGGGAGTPTIKRLLVEYAEAPHPFIDPEVKTSSDEEADRPNSYLVQVIFEGLTQAGLGRETAASYLRWAEKVGRARVDHIVSEKHRGAYRRAAETLVALGEYYAATARPDSAAALIQEYRERFNRHIAFKRELREVLSESGLITDL